MMAKDGVNVDGPYSWMIAFLAFLMFFVMYAMTRVSGLLFIETMTYYDIDRAAASFPFSISYALRYLAGPLAGYLSGRFGIRFVILFGCGMSVVGVGGCCLAQDILMINLCWGVLLGLGSCFACSPLQQLNNMYFDKHVVSANGLSFSGASLAGFVAPPLVEFMLNEYGIQGTYLLLTGLTLNAVPIGLLLKEPPNRLEEGEYSKCKEIETIYRTIHIDDSYLSNKENSSTSKSMLRGELNLKQPNILAKNLCRTPSKENASTREALTCQSSSKVFRNCGFNSVIVDNAPKAQEIHNIKYEEKNTKKLATEENKHSLKDLGVFLDPYFLIISFEAGVIATLFFVLPTILNDFGLDKGISVTYSTYMVMAMSIGDLVAKVGLGWVTDRGHMSATNFCALCLLILAACIAALVFINDLRALFVVISLIGLGLGAAVPLAIAFVKEFIKPRRQLMANASVDILSAPLLLSTPSIIGYFRDGLGSYDYFIYLQCVLSLLCCVMIVILPYIQKRKHKTKLTFSHM